MRKIQSRGKQAQLEIWEPVCKTAEQLHLFAVSIFFEEDF